MGRLGGAQQPFWCISGQRPGFDLCMFRAFYEKRFRQCIVLEKRGHGHFRLRRLNVVLFFFLGDSSMLSIRCVLYCDRRWKNFGFSCFLVLRGLGSLWHHNLCFFYLTCTHRRNFRDDNHFNLMYKIPSTTLHSSLAACSNSPEPTTSREKSSPSTAGDHRLHQLHQLVVKWMQAGLIIPNDAPTACVFLAKDVRRVLSRVLHRRIL
jgi:hypothetical protein